MAINSTGYPDTIMPGSAWGQAQRGMGRHYWVAGYPDARVSAVAGGTRQVRIGAGWFGAHGITNNNSADIVYSLPAVASGYKYFMVVADHRWDDDGGGFRTVISHVDGTAARAIPSRLNSPGTRVQMPLALVRITAGSTVPTEVVDLRLVVGWGASTIVIYDDLALNLQHGAGYEMHNVMTGVRRLLVTDSSGALTWIVTSDHLLSTAYIPNLPASKITSGKFAANLIPSLPASIITSGQIPNDRIGTLNANKLTAGTLPVARINGLSPSFPQITTTHVERKIGDNHYEMFLGSREAGPGFYFNSPTEPARVAYLSRVSGRWVCPGSYSSTTGATANVYITTDGSFMRSSSSRRYKDDIEDAAPMPNLLDVQPRTWLDKPEKERGEAHRRYFGAIAEELDALGLRDLVVYNDDGTPEAISYDRVAIALIPLIKAQQQALEALTERVAALERA